MDRAHHYIQSLPDAEQQEFHRIITLVQTQAPEAVLDFAYGMPAFKYKGKPLLYIGAFKNHMSLFPTSGPIAELEERIKPYKAAKATLQFTVNNPLPDDLIKDIIAIRIAQIEK